MEISAEELNQRLQDLPFEIYKCEARCNILSRIRDRAKTNLDLDYAQFFRFGKAQKMSDGAARQYAVVETHEKRIVLDSAENRLAAAGSKLRERQNEFVSARKLATIRTEEMREAQQRSRWNT